MREDVPYQSPHIWTRTAKYSGRSLKWLRFPKSASSRCCPEAALSAEIWTWNTRGETDEKSWAEPGHLAILAPMGNSAPSCPRTHRTAETLSVASTPGLALPSKSLRWGRCFPGSLAEGAVAATAATAVIDEGAGEDRVPRATSAIRASRAGLHLVSRRHQDR